MKRMDEGKVSLVDFLRSIKFARHEKAKYKDESNTHFATFNPQAGTKKRSNGEDSKLIRSAN